MGHAESASPTLFDAGPTKPTFLRIEDNGRFLLLRIGHHDIGGTHFDARVTAVAEDRVKLLPLVGCRGVGCHVDFVTHEGAPPDFSKLVSMALIIFFIRRGIGRLQVKIQGEFPYFDPAVFLSHGKMSFPFGRVHLRVVEPVEIQVHAAALSRQ
jgi:hypothetical protein